MAIRREGDRGMGRWGEKISSVVSLKLLYNDKKGCHSRENGNPAEKTGFPRIKYGAGLVKYPAAELRASNSLKNFPPPCRRSR